ncbi:hypothetical protein D1092_06635 [Bartonella krasnovii]|uniref:Uncharacterized protein n=1 Tax=Bartonella krasnovii TaxID=2267275 RepID=A0A5B9D3R1_9HYPH|nr:hypothetical protein D1092_06635 [Bartonella krasnovii]
MLCLYHSDFGGEVSEVVFMLCILSINFDGSCIESGIFTVKRGCAFSYAINGKSNGRLGKVCVKEDSSWIEFLHVKHGE